MLMSHVRSFIPRLFPPPVFDCFSVCKYGGGRPGRFDDVQVQVQVQVQSADTVDRGWSHREQCLIKSQRLFLCYESTNWRPEH